MWRPPRRRAARVVEEKGVVVGQRPQRGRRPQLLRRRPAALSAGAERSRAAARSAGGEGPSGARQHREELVAVSFRCSTAMRCSGGASRGGSAPPWRRNTLARTFSMLGKSTATIPPGASRSMYSDRASCVMRCVWRRPARKRRCRSSPATYTRSKVLRSLGSWRRRAATSRPSRDVQPHGRVHDRDPVGGQRRAACTPGSAG